MSPNHAGEPVNWEKFVESARWQRLQDRFADVLGFPLRTVNLLRELLVKPSWGSMGLDHEQAMKLLRLGEELEVLLPLEHPPKELSIVTVPLGVTYGLVPIRSETADAIAYFVAGPVLVGLRESEQQFHQRMQGLGINPEEGFWTLFLSIRHYTFSGLQAALALLEEVGNSLVSLTLSKRTPELLSDSGQDGARNHVFHLLLDAAVKCTGAEGGSIMLYTDKNELEIKTAQGLSESVVTQTHVKRGEGIAGFVACQRTILLIDETQADESIRARMQRPELVSSLVASLVTDTSSEPLGVLSLRTSKPQARFTHQHVDLLRRFLELAAVALGRFRF